MKFVNKDLLVHEQQMDVFLDRVSRINVASETSFSPKITGFTTRTSLFTDEPACRMSFENPMTFNGMSLLGKVTMSKTDDSEFMPCKKLSPKEQKYVESLDSISGRSKYYFAFRADKTIKIGEQTYKKGDCFYLSQPETRQYIDANLLTTIDNMFSDFDSDLELSDTVSPSFYDAKLLTKYALAVGQLKIDEAFNYYKNNYDKIADGTEKLFNNGRDKFSYNTPHSYRQCEKSEAVTDKKYDYNEGYIMKLAKVLYRMNECDDNVYDIQKNNNIPFLSTEAVKGKYPVDILKQIADNYHLLDLVKNNGDLDRLADSILSYTESSKALDILSSGKAYVPSSDGTGGGLIRHDACAVIEDICDTYLLQQGKCYMHELDRPLFKYHNADDIDRRWDIVDDAYDDRYVGRHGNYSAECAVALKRQGLVDYTVVDYDDNENAYDSMLKLVVSNHPQSNERLAVFIQDKQSESVKGKKHNFKSKTEELKNHNKKSSDKLLREKKKTDMDKLDAYDNKVQGINPKLISPMSTKDGSCMMQDGEKLYKATIYVPPGTDVSCRVGNKFSRRSDTPNYVVISYIKESQLISYVNQQHKELFAVVFDKPSVRVGYKSTSNGKWNVGYMFCDKLEIAKQRAQKMLARTRDARAVSVMSDYLSSDTEDDFTFE